MDSERFSSEPSKILAVDFAKVGFTRTIRSIIVVSGVARSTPRFVLGVLRLIHSDIRLLCGTDAAIGAVVGFLFGYAIVGAIIGGFLGVLNYELVSKRLLRVSM